MLEDLAAALAGAHLLNQLDGGVAIAPSQFDAIGVFLSQITVLEGFDCPGNGAAG